MPLCYVCQNDKPIEEMACKDTCRSCMEMQALGNQVVDQCFHELLTGPEKDEPMEPYKEKLFFFASRILNRREESSDFIKMGEINYVFHEIWQKVEQNPSLDIMCGDRTVTPMQIIVAGDNVLDRVLAVRDAHLGRGDHMIGIHYWDVTTGEGEVWGVKAGVYYAPTEHLGGQITRYSAIDLGLTVLR